MDRKYPPREFGKMVGRCVRTLQESDRKGLLKAHRTATNRRYYTHEQYLAVLGEIPAQRLVATYCRVSSAAQKPDCENRKGDEFHCRSCGFEGDADWVAAVNLLRRMNDPDIKPWTPVVRVKQILDGRYRRRLEISGALAQAKGRTVPGKAVDTAPTANLTAEGIENGEDMELDSMPF